MDSIDSVQEWDRDSLLHICVYLSETEAIHLKRVSKQLHSAVSSLAISQQFYYLKLCHLLGWLPLFKMQDRPLVDLFNACRTVSEVRGTGILIQRMTVPLTRQLLDLGFVVVADRCSILPDPEVQSLIEEYLIESNLLLGTRYLLSSKSIIAREGSKEVEERMLLSISYSGEAIRLQSHPSTLELLKSSSNMHSID
ncbi:Hypothetical protein POVR2_LOCUS257 [uncultured virus]|nr:Hypothetical protein POVR2_LOCUS257 [uncultured virus]